MTLMYECTQCGTAGSFAVDKRDEFAVGMTLAENHHAAQRPECPWDKYRIRYSLLDDEPIV